MNRKTLAFMVVSLLVLQIFGAPLCLANTKVNGASLTGVIYDRGIDTDHNGKFDYLEVSVKVNVTKADEYEIQISGLSDSADGVIRRLISVEDYTSAYLDVGIHLLNISLYGPTIYASGINPACVKYIGLFRVSYQFLTKQLYLVDSRGLVRLSRVYNYNEFDAPFMDMEARLIVDPDGQVHLAGALDYTHITPPNEGLGAQGSARIVANGGLTSALANCTIVIPSEFASQFPFNSTSFSSLEEYLEGHYSMGANATVTLPVSVGSEFPFNVTDASLKSTYSNGLLNTEISLNTTLPERIVTQFIVVDLPMLNSTDFTIQGQYLNDSLSGTIIIHLLPGFPLGDINIDFQGNRTDLSLTGSVLVIYNVPIDPIGPLNQTTLEQMLLNLNSSIPGHGPNSLYQISKGLLDCQYLYTNMTPYDTIGANVAFNMSIHGDFLQALASVITKYGNIGSEEIQELVYSALNVTVSSVKSASFLVAYTHVSRGISVKLSFVDEFLNFVRDLSALVKEISIPPSPPIFSLYPLIPLGSPIILPESFSSSTTTSYQNTTISSVSPMMMVVTSWVYGALLSLRFLNATLPYVEDAKIELTYGSVSKKFEFKATVEAEFPEEMPPEELPKELPPDIRELIETLQNTTYCKLKSSRESIVYENSVANIQEYFVIEGDLNAEINFVKHVVLTYINKTSQLPKPLMTINETRIDVSNLRINFDFNETCVTGDLEGLTLLPPREPLNATFFTLERFFNITESPQESPVQGEQLRITIEGGSNVTHAIILHRPETVPPPNEVSPDMRTMVWYNQSLSSLKDLIFEIQPQSYGVTVAVNDQFGNPIPNATVTVYRPDGTLWTTLSTDDYGCTSTLNVDYKFMPFGPYNITATYQGILGTQSYAIDHIGTYTIILPVNSPQVVINITDPAGVTPANPVTADATQNAATTLTINQISDPVVIAVRNVTAPERAPPPGTWKLLGSYVQIIANDTTITVNATLRIYYTPEQLAAAGVDEGSLEISCWNSTSGQWVPIEGQVNTAGHYVEAVTTHLSVWAVMGQPKAAPPIWTQTWFLSLVIGIIILVAAAAAYVTSKKKPMKQVVKK